MDIGLICIYIGCIIFLAIICKIFILPIKVLIKLVINSIFGIFIIYLINIMAAVFKIHIGINFFTVLIVGLLGIPGSILLILLSI